MGLLTFQDSERYECLRIANIEPKNYLVCVGALNPRKNIESILQWQMTQVLLP